MNKYTWLFLTVIYILVVTTVANAIELEYANLLDGGFENPTNSIDSAFNFLKTLGNLLTFQLKGVPAIINLFMTVPIYVVILMIIVSWIRGVD